MTNTGYTVGQSFPFPEETERLYSVVTDSVGGVYVIEGETVVAVVDTTYVDAADAVDYDAKLLEAIGNAFETLELDAREVDGDAESVRLPSGEIVPNELDEDEDEAPAPERILDRPALVGETIVVEDGERFIVASVLSDHSVYVRRRGDAGSFGPIDELDYRVVSS